MKVRFTPPPQAEVSRGMKVPYGPGRRPAVQWRWLVILALVASPFVYLLFSLAWPYLMVTAPGVVVLGKESVTAASAGVVHTVQVRSKPKRLGAFLGRSRSWKKAFVKLAPGERIEFFEGAGA